MSTTVERKEVADRQLDALLERLDRLCDEVHSLTRRLDTQEQLLRISRELGTLNESLQALAYAALGHQPPSVRRRRTG
jgi:chromosome segregation ATPase